MAMTESESYRERLVALLREAVYPHVEEWERGQVFPREVVRRLGGEGFFAPCLRLAEASNARALALNFPLFRVLIEELAKTRSFGLTLTVSMHVGVFLPLVARLAHPELREHVLA